MKVVCAHETYKGHNMELTYGKAYEVINQQPFWDFDGNKIGQVYQIIDDRGTLAWYNQVVIPMEEWREKQLNKLLL